MNSSIKVDFAGGDKGLQPVIRVKLSTEGDDVRDGLLKAFFEQLGSQSSWLSTSFDHHIVNGTKDSTTYITIYPVTPQELPETVEIIKKRIAERAGNFNALVPLQSNQVKSTKDLIENKWQVLSISREGNSDIDGTPMHYKLVVNKSLRGLREGVLKEAIEDVINNSENWVEEY